jgi:hypothetical protein
MADNFLTYAEAGVVIRLGSVEAVTGDGPRVVYSGHLDLLG